MYSSESSLSNIPRSLKTRRWCHSLPAYLTCHCRLREGNWPKCHESLKASGLKAERKVPEGSRTRSIITILTEWWYEWRSSVIMKWLSKNCCSYQTKSSILIMTTWHDQRMLRQYVIGTLFRLCLNGNWMRVTDVKWSLKQASCCPS